MIGKAFRNYALYIHGIVPQCQSLQIYHFFGLLASTALIFFGSTFIKADRACSGVRGCREIGFKRVCGLFFILLGFFVGIDNLIKFPNHAGKNERLKWVRIHLAIAGCGFR